jgi:integrase
VITALESLHGSTRQGTLVVLRSLFKHCKKTRVVFINPTSRIRVGDRGAKLIQPLDPDQIQRTVNGAARRADRLIVALAAVHAARSATIRALQLDDVDLGNRRLTIAAHVRPLDELTYHLLLEWLDYRRTRWPYTANPHLIINNQTAHKLTSASAHWIGDGFRGQHATLERLRVDRQLEEALTQGPDPLHLAVVFDLDEKTAIRYAAAARQLLEAEIERHAPS